MTAQAETTYDPTDALHAALSVPERTVDPLATLAMMARNLDISDNERDAGEILHRLATAVNSTAEPMVQVRFPVRTGSTWGVVTETRRAASARMTDMLAAIKTDGRRRAVSRLLVAREPAADMSNTTPISAGLADVAAHLWGAGNASTFTLDGITLAGGNAPTPERAIKAELTDGPDGSRRVVDGFERMYERGQLDSDPAINKALYAAGRTYQQDHYLGGMAPLGAIDYSREHVDGAGQQHVSERQMHHRTRWRNARKAMTQKYATVVDAVLIEGRALYDIGLEVTSYRKREYAAAVAKERLNVGLTMIALQNGNLRRSS